MESEDECSGSKNAKMDRVIKKDRIRNKYFRG